MTRPLPDPTDAVKASPDAEPRIGREACSALVDGEIADADLAAAIRAWSADGSLRRGFDEYHLIGDILRSDQLASGRPSLLPALRERLASEPVPIGIAKPARPIRRWLMPAAAAAGFAAVGVVVLTVGPGADTGGSRAALAIGAPVVGAHQAVAMSASAPPVWAPVDGSVIRDARLDAYFEAHRGAAGAMPSAVPGGALRSVELLVPQR